MVIKRCQNGNSKDRGTIMQRYSNGNFILIPTVSLYLYVLSFGWWSFTRTDCVSTRTHDIIRLLTFCSRVTWKPTTWWKYHQILAWWRLITCTTHASHMINSWCMASSNAIMSWICLLGIFFATGKQFNVPLWMFETKIRKDPKGWEQGFCLLEDTA